MYSRGALLPLLSALALLAICLRGWGDAYPGPVYGIQTLSGVPYGKALVNGGSSVKDLLLDVRVPIGNASTHRPALVIVHGGAYTGGTRSDLAGIAKHFTQRGFVTFCISYRLLGENPPYGIASCVADAKTAVRWVRANCAVYGVEPNAIGVLGHSAGAYTAVEVTVTDPSSYPCDMPNEPINNVGVSSAVQAGIELSGGTFSPGAFDANDAPLMICHGTNDPIVVFSNAQTLNTLCANAGMPCEFWPIPNWGHGQDPGITYIDGVNLYELMTHFLVTSLGKASDIDGDDLADSDEGFADVDGDALPNYIDPDSDGDSIPDLLEGTVDTDSDGTPNYLDRYSDADSDGLLDAGEGSDDPDKDGLPNFRDLDSDEDGIPDAVERNGDIDGDGLRNFVDTDSDGDGISDALEGVSDTDGDGQADYCDRDSDDDGIPDALEGSADRDWDGLPNFRDLDSDGDGIPDAVEGLGDSDGDGRPNFLDIDSDGDRIPDALEGIVDTDGDGTPDYLDPDSDDDGLPDSVEHGLLLDPYNAQNTKSVPAGPWWAVAAILAFAGSARLGRKRPTSVQ